MSNVIQIKVLIAILAVLIVIAAVLRKGGDHSIPITPANLQLQQKLAQKLQPSQRRYLVP